MIYPEDKISDAFLFFLDEVKSKISKVDDDQLIKSNLARIEQPQYGLYENFGSNYDKRNKRI